MNIAVLGAGAWGTALAIALSRQHQIRLWARDADLVASLRRERSNARYLPGFQLSVEIDLTAQLDNAVAAANLVLAVTPTSGLRDVASNVAATRGSAALVWCCKGFEASSSLLPHQVVQAAGAGIARVGVLSGPSFAQEVAAGKPAALTLAASDHSFAQDMAAALSDSKLRVYSSDDVVGVELGGALKNVIAIAVGICDGLGLGNNARAALITRGLAEMSRLAAKLGAKPETLMGLTGLGDLVLTCTGDLSRNRRVGLEIAAGKSLAETLVALGHVAEGVTTVKEVRRLAQQHATPMPICEAVHAVLYQGLPPLQAVSVLMGRDPKPEA